MYIKIIKIITNKEELKDNIKYEVQNRSIKIKIKIQ